MTARLRIPRQRGPSHREDRGERIGAAAAAELLGVAPSAVPELAATRGIEVDRFGYCRADVERLRRELELEASGEFTAESDWLEVRQLVEDAICRSSRFTLADPRPGGAIVTDRAVMRRQRLRRWKALGVRMRPDPDAPTHFDAFSAFMRDAGFTGWDLPQPQLNRRIAEYAGRRDRLRAAAKSGGAPQPE